MKHILFVQKINLALIAIYSLIVVFVFRDYHLLSVISLWITGSTVFTMVLISEQSKELNLPKKQGIIISLLIIATMVGSFVWTAYSNIPTSYNMPAIFWSAVIVNCLLYMYVLRQKKTLAVTGS